MINVTAEDDNKAVVAFPPDRTGHSRVAVMQSNRKVYELNEAARARAAAKRRLLSFPSFDPNNLTAA